MAILHQGLNGSFTGKAGHFVGRNLHGQNVLTGLHEVSELELNGNQMGRQNKFSLITNFLSYISDVIAIGFKPKARKYSAMNLAVSHNMKHAVTGPGADVEIVFPNLQISRGNLRKPRELSAVALAGAVLMFAWCATTVSANSNFSDQLMIMVYNPAKYEFVRLINAAVRKDLTCQLQLPADFVGDEVHCYVSFIGSEGRASDSVYTGALVVL